MTMFSENDSLNKADLQLVRTLAFGARMLSLGVRTKARSEWILCKDSAAGI